MPIWCKTHHFIWFQSKGKGSGGYGTACSIKQAQCAGHPLDQGGAAVELGWSKGGQDPIFSILVNPCSRGCFLLLTLFLFLRLDTMTHRRWGEKNIWFHNAQKLWSPKEKSSKIKRLQDLHFHLHHHQWFFLFPKLGRHRCCMRQNYLSVVRLCKFANTSFV